MEQGLFDITANGTTTLIPIYSRAGAIQSISICNYDTDNVDISVYLEDESATKVYMIHEITLKPDVTLILDDNISFNNATLGLKMEVTGTTPKVSVIIK